MKKVQRNTTDTQLGNFIVSIGCPRRLELCNEFGRKIDKRRRMKYDSADKDWIDRFGRAAAIFADPALSRWLAA